MDSHSFHGGEFILMGGGQFLLEWAVAKVSLAPVPLLAAYLPSDPSSLHHKDCQNLGEFLPFSRKLQSLYTYELK